MSDEVTTYFSQSAGRDLVIKDMPYPQLVNTINAVSRRLGGGTDKTLDALRAELARRPPPDPTGEAPPSAARQAADTAKPTASDHRLEMGANNPPEDSDPLRDRLIEAHDKLIGDIADHELAAARLPKTVETEEEVATITEWVVKARALYKAAEEARVAAKEPYLHGTKVVDGFFGSIKNDLEERAKKIDQRKGPFLQAKAAAEEAARRAAEAEKRQAAEEAAERERKEREEREAAERAQREAEARVREAANAESRAAAEAEMRQRAQEAQLARDAEEQAAKDRVAAERSADRDAKIADGKGKHSLGRTVAGGGSSTLKKSTKHRIVKPLELLRSLGPLGRYFTDAQVEEALGRACRDDNRPGDIAGVEFYEHSEVQTR